MVNNRQGIRAFQSNVFLRRGRLFRGAEVVSLRPDIFNLWTPSHEKVLLLNGGKQFAHSDGRYNTTLHDTALAVLDRGGIDVKVTHIDAGYDVAEKRSPSFSGPT